MTGSGIRPPRKPTDRLTRAEYLAELFSILDETERVATRKQWHEMAAEVRIAKRVLGCTLSVREMIDLEALYKLEEDDNRSDNTGSGSPD
jgi:hypothetical protein